MPQNLQICSPHPPSSHLEITNNHLALCASQEPQTSKKRPGFFLCSAQRIKNTHREKTHSNKGKNMQPHPLRKNLVCHFPSLSTRERGRERQGERGKREHVTMVTDSVAPRPSAKMLGHIQHPSVPAVCVCACVYYVFVCSLRWSGTPGEREPLTAKKVSHLFPDMYSLHTHTHTFCRIAEAAAAAAGLGW